ncbi:hypothetical protein KC660_04640, partial [Candidatus Dojkabacteria bacterium]|nr:hypothetical protein [Candidatus Dojkabacteria bacterium]
WQANLSNERSELLTNLESAEGLAQKTLVSKQNFEYHANAFCNQIHKWTTFARSISTIIVEYDISIRK